MTTKKILFKTLLSATLSAGFLVACSNNNVDAEKQELAAKKSQQEKLTTAANERQKKYEALVAELEQEKSQLEAQQADLDARIKEFSDKKSEREQQMAAYSEAIARQQKDISVYTQKIDALKKTFQEEQARITKRMKELNEKAKILKIEKDNALKELSTEQQRLAEIQSRIITAEKDLETKVNKILSTAQAEADLKKEKADEIMNKARNEATQMRLDAETKIASDRAEYDQYVAEMNETMDQRDKELIATAAKLLAEQSDLAQAQKQLASDIANLQKDQDALTKAQSLLAANQRQHAASVAQFDAQVEALRELFTKEGKGDVFDKITADGVFNFRMTLWGHGTVSQILSVRQQIAAFNIENGLSSENNNRVFSPELAYHSQFKINDFDTYLDILGEAAQGLVDSNIHYITDLNEKIIVNDVFMVKGTATSIKKLRDSINATLSTPLVDLGVSNIWASARPIDNVRVNLKMTLLGSSSIDQDRELKPVRVFKRMKQVDAKLMNLMDIDLSNPGKFVAQQFGEANLCEVVDVSCLKVIKEAGLLDNVQTRTYKDGNGQSLTDEISDQDLLEKLLQVSIDKLTNTEAIKAAMSNGVLIKHDFVQKEAWGHFFTGQTYIDTVVNEDDRERKLRNFEGNKEILNQLKDVKIIEKIQLTYEVVMVDKIEDQEGRNLYLSQFVNEDAALGTGVITRSKDLAEQGLFEIPLPHKWDSSSSNFTDLSLKDFVHGIAAPAVDPLASKDYDYRIIGRFQYDIDRLIGEHKLTPEEALDHKSISERYKAANPTVQAAVKKYAEDYHAHVALIPQYKEYNAQVEEAKNHEFRRRTSLLIGQLSNLLDVLKGK